MIQKITQNNGNFWTVNLIMRAKIVNQSSDFPVRRTGSYRHKKSTDLEWPLIIIPMCSFSIHFILVTYMGVWHQRNYYWIKIRIQSIIIFIYRQFI